MERERSEKRRVKERERSEERAQLSAQKSLKAKFKTSHQLVTQSVQAQGTTYFISWHLAVQDVTSL